MYSHFIRSAARRAASVPANLALRGINMAPVASALERRHALALAGHVRPDGLRDAEAQVVAGLEQSGLFVTSLAALGLASPANDGSDRAEDILSCGGKVAATLAERVAAMGERRPTVIAAAPGDILRHSLLYRWGLNAVVLRIVEAYLGLPPAYDGPLLFHTPADGREAGTRRWHLDREDRRVIKLALYLHDVDEAAGPFQIVRHENHADGRFRYQVCDTQMLRRILGQDIGPSDVTSCTGPAGTLVFADTARFYHRGKPATGRARSAIFYGYFARRPRHPFFCARSGLTRSQVASLVEGLPAEQQASALWRDDLPLLARLVPPSLT